MTKLTFTPRQYTVQDIINRYRNENLNLEPGFQRKSVWTLSDRKKLIDSVARGFPLPAVFFYKREENGRLVYDVIDGKQRLETILGFAGELRGSRFAARLQLDGDDARQEYDWRRLVRLRRQTMITGYCLQVIEVDGTLADIVDLFVRINSTGKALTKTERLHAKYGNSPFFKVAAKLANRLAGTLNEEGIISETQISRMKHVELIAELMLSVHRDSPINAKAALEAVMQSREMTERQLATAAARTMTAIRRTLRLLPDIAATRFHRLSDFYSLTLLMAQFERAHLVLSDRTRNRQAAELLRAFSAGVDHLKEQQRKLQPIEAEASLHRDYLMTVSEGTDKINAREKRQQILRGLLEPIFERKDEKRLFSAEQRRILWNSSDAKVCAAQACRRSLGWADFTADHINPWSKGGRTELANAAIYCHRCNASKGNRRKARTRRTRRAA
jgi:Protein of unknown function DUF262/HNH endonuclease